MILVVVCSIYGHNRRETETKTKYKYATQHIERCYTHEPSAHTFGANECDARG